MSKQSPQKSVSSSTGETSDRQTPHGLVISMACMVYFRNESTAQEMCTNCKQIMES